MVYLIVSSFFSKNDPFWCTKVLEFNDIKDVRLNKEYFFSHLTHKQIKVSSSLYYIYYSRLILYYISESIYNE